MVRFGSEPCFWNSNAMFGWTDLARCHVCWMGRLSLQESGMNGLDCPLFFVFEIASLGRAKIAKNSSHLQAISFPMNGACVEMSASSEK